MSLPGIFEPSGLPAFLAAGHGIDPEDIFSTQERVTGDLVLIGDGVVERPLDGALSVEYVAHLTGSGVIAASGALAVEFSANLSPVAGLAVEFSASLEREVPMVPSFLLIDADSRLS